MRFYHDHRSNRKWVYIKTIVIAKKNLHYKYSPIYFICYFNILVINIIDLIKFGYKKWVSLLLKKRIEYIKTTIIYLKVLIYDWFTLLLKQMAWI